MKYFVITDSTDTQVGLRLAGVDGVVVREESAVREALRTALDDSSIGILLVTEQLATLCADQLAPIKMSGHRPLVVEIPDRHSTGRARSPARTVRRIPAHSDATAEAGSNSPRAAAF